MRRSLLLLPVLIWTLLTLTLLPLAPAGAAPAGEWGWPLPPPHEVVGAFDPPDQPWLAGHRGVDLRGHTGEPVRAAGAGTVAFAGVVAGVPVVSVRHPGGLLTTYQPVRPSVAEGDAVDMGQRLGRLVASGSHCAPAACLHWGLRRGDDYLDPLLLVGPLRLRLLPLHDANHSGGLPTAAGVAMASSTALLACWVRRRPSPQQRPGIAVSRAGR